MNDLRKHFNFGFPRKLSRKAPYYVSSFPKFWNIRLNVINGLDLKRYRLCFALMPPSCGYLRPPLTLRRKQFEQRTIRGNFIFLGNEETRERNNMII